MYECVICLPSSALNFPNDLSHLTQKKARVRLYMLITCDHRFHTVVLITCAIQISCLFLLWCTLQLKNTKNLQLDTSLCVYVGADETICDLAKVCFWIRSPWEGLFPLVEWQVNTEWFSGCSICLCEFESIILGLEMEYWRKVPNLLEIPVYGDYYCGLLWIPATFGVVKVFGSVPLHSTWQCVLTT